jgi:hypothetical protein
MSAIYVDYNIIYKDITPTEKKNETRLFIFIYFTPLDI